MKRIDFKSIITGICIGSMGIATVFAAGGLTATTAEDVSVVLNGEAAVLVEPLVSIVKDGEDTAQLHIPLRELLEYMGYDVKWEGETATVYITGGSEALLGAKTENAKEEEIFMVDVGANTKLKLGADEEDHQAQLTIGILCHAPEEQAMLQEKDTEIAKLITHILEGYTYEDVNAPAFMNTINEVLLKAINELITDMDITAIYIQEFYVM